VNSPLWQLTLARIREFFREPAAIFWVYGFPLLLAVALGTAFRNRPVEKIRIDLSRDDPGVMELKAELAADERLDVHITHDERNRLRTAKTDLAFYAGLNGQPDRYLFDPNRPESVLAKNAVENARLKKFAIAKPTIDETFTEPGSRYIDFLIPGLIGLNLMGGGLFGVGFVIVDMRVRKLLKRFLATPMRKTDFLLSLMLSRLLFTLIEMILLVAFAYFAFDIRIRGNVLAFAVLVLAGGMAFAGLGLLIACRAKTIETVSGLMNAIMLPMYVLSGVFFSSERFPDAIQPVLKALPLTQVNDGLRAVMNDGGGFEVVVVPLATLTAWGVVSFVVALKLFRWR
jgi:ABC-type multidrug transport system permease subunit